jgi:flagellar basal body-associated protein FliL
MTNTGSNSDTEHSATLNVTQARQGRRGKHVLWVLAVSLVLVVAALFGSWFMKSDELATTESHNARQTADAEVFNAPDPAVKQTDQMIAPGVPGSTSPASQETQTR